MTNLLQHLQRVLCLSSAGPEGNVLIFQQKRSLEKSYAQHRELSVHMH